MKRLVVLLLPALLLVASSIHPASALTPDYSWLCPRAEYHEGTSGADWWYQLPDNSTGWKDGCYFTGGGADGIIMQDAYAYAHMDGFCEILSGSQDDTIDLTPQAPHANTQACLNATVDGQAGDDTIIGLPHHEQVYYGGTGNDTITGGDVEDDIFGGDYCEETNLWGFWDVTDNESLDNYACSQDGGDVLKGGPGNDWIWDSNSDQYADGHADEIRGQDGTDVCTGGSEDTFYGCETINIIPDVS